MRAGQHLGRVRVECAIVNVQTEPNRAREADILLGGTYGGVGEEKGAGDECANDHCVAAAEEWEIAHPAGEHGTEDATDVDEGVVAPCFVG